MTRLITVSMALAMVCCSLVVASPAPKDRPPIYDEAADAKSDVAAAVARAKGENKRVLLDIGANWCGWCYLLHDVFETDKTVHPIVNAEYEVVMIDMGNNARNQALLDSYGIHTQGYPYLAILDGDNKLVTQQDTGALEDGPKHDVKKVAAFLDQWKASPADAKQVLADALEQAKQQDKRVFLRFGAPWCGWCRRLDGVLHQPPVADALASEFVVIKIDTQRMTGGADVQKQYQSGGGIPWYAILATDGKVVSTSELNGQNIGFPTEPAEIDYLMTMFTNGGKRMTEEQKKALHDALEKGASEAKAKLNAAH